MADKLRACWKLAHERFWEAFDSCFTYKKTARHAREYVRGLMATLGKNGWQLAEFIEDSSPYAVQNFLSRAIWSADKTRDQLTKNAMEILLDILIHKKQKRICVTTMMASLLMKGKIE